MAAPERASSRAILETTGFRRAVAFAAVLVPVVALGAEYHEVEDIAPESAEEASVGLENISEPPARRPRREVLRDRLDKAPPFWRDGRTDLGIRVYDFRRENGIESIAEAFAVGNELTFRSGRWRDRLSLAATWHTSYGIDAPEGLGSTGLLAPDQSDLSMISRAYLQYNVSEPTFVRLYRQDFNMPYINRQDVRMIPNTHEAYTLLHAGERLQWIAGHVTKMKRRDSEEFIPMGEVAGLPSDDTGTSVAGLRYTFPNQTSLGTIVQHTSDLFTTDYSEVSFKRTLTDEWGTQLAAQLTNQRSTGSEELGDFDTYSWGLRGRVSFRGAVLTAAYTKTGGEAIFKPFGGTPGFTSSMLFDFDRAREEALRIGLSQNLAKRGLPGISVIVNYTKSRNAETESGILLPDADEIAVTADFRPQKGFLQGLWLRIRWADGDRGSPEADRQDVRVIVNYSLGAFR